MTDPADEHVMEAIGRCRVVVRDGRVVEVGEPVIYSCPLARKFARPVHPIEPGAVKENIEHRIRSFGLCTPDRTVMMEGDYVGFGASELLSGAIQAGLVDCAVIAGDGAGTVLAPVPSLVQGIGGRMSGLVKTSPHPEVIARIEARGGLVLDPATARIDQAEGVARAYSEGFGKVAVTVAGGEEARFIRKEFPATLIIAVHTTGVSREEAQVMADSADLVTACASRHIRDVAGSRALMQAGSAIPVFAMTGRGKEIILEKIRHISSPLLVTGMELPFSGNECPDPLV